ncbi:MAG TPA: hypothetical protein VEK57_08275 [Thermoanaerobaculia bacterium]|nr:hypothetical protein [Thermoanaerobaculia bacterium]
MTPVAVTGGTFNNAHLGDNNTYYVYTHGQTSDEPFDFDAYVESVCARLRNEAAEYVQLDVEPIVTSVAHPGAGREHRTLVDAASRERQMVVVGAAGSGKTSSLRYLAAMGAEDDELRIYIELSRYRKTPYFSDLDALLILVGEVINDWSAAARPPSIPTLRRVMAERPTMLLFDGLNEVDASIRDVCLRAVEDLAFTFEKCRIVLSTRPHGFEPPQKWSTFRLRELGDDQIAQFLRARADDATAAAVLERLHLDDNPLLRLPLFLTYAIRLVQRSEEGAARLVRSRTSVVADYVAELFRDKRHGKMDEEEMTNVLSRLALTLQQVGQSLPLGEAGESREMLSALAARGFLRVDARYVRFWHHTIQEYFYAEGQRRRFAAAKPWTRDWHMARALSRRPDEDALTFLPTGASERELKGMMRTASRVNVSLATRWADDLDLDGRAPDVVTSYLKAVKRRLRRTTVYSRVTHERQGIGVALFLYLLWLVVGFLFVPVFGENDRQNALGVFLAGIALHYLLTYRGCTDAATIAGLTRKVRSEQVRAGLTAIFESIVRAPLASRDLREIGLTVMQPERETIDALDALQTSRAPYLTIQLLAFSEAPKASAVLHAVLEAGGGNLYSRAALLALLHRATRDREEADRLRTLARTIWMGSGDWLYRRVAGRCLQQLDPQLRMQCRWETAIRFILALAFGIAALYASFLTIVVLELKFNEYEVMLLVPFLCAAAIALYAWAVGTKRVYGYHGLDGLSPLRYFLMCTVGGWLTFSFLPLILVLPHAGRMRFNARGLDMTLVRQLVHNDFREVQQ